MGQEDETKSVAILVGYNSKGDIVYEETLDLGSYYDGMHLWDSASEVLQVDLVKLCGTLYEDDGSIYQEFISYFSQETGIYSGGQMKLRDGTIKIDNV